MHVEHPNKVIQWLGNAFLGFAFCSFVIGVGMAVGYVSSWKHQEEVAIKVGKIGEALHTEQVELVSEDGDTFFVKADGKIYHAKVEGLGKVSGVFPIGENQMKAMLSAK